MLQYTYSKSLHNNNVDQIELPLFFTEYEEMNLRFPLVVSPKKVIWL